MSKLSNLRDALVKLEAAEDALFHARQSFRESPSYSRLDHQYEIIGDAANIIRDILGIEEGERMKKIGLAQAQVAYYRGE